MVQLGWVRAPGGAGAAAHLPARARTLGPRLRTLAAPRSGLLPQTPGPLAAGVRGVGRVPPLLGNVGGESFMRRDWGERVGARRQLGEPELVSALFSSLGPALLVGELQARLETVRHGGGGVGALQRGVVAQRAHRACGRQRPANHTVSQMSGVFQTLVKNLLDVHLFRNIVNVSDVGPLVGVWVDALGHQVPQTFTVLVRGQRRVVALAGGRECYVWGNIRVDISMYLYQYQ